MHDHAIDSPAPSPRSQDIASVVNHIVTTAADAGSPADKGYAGLVTQFVTMVTAETGEDAETLLLRAFGLYWIALDALKDGNRVAVVDADGELVQEITGIAPGTGRLKDLAARAPVYSLSE